MELENFDQRNGSGLTELVLGALNAISVVGPDHVRQAAVSIRALFELMPQSFQNAPVREDPADTSEKLNEILDAFDVVTSKSACFRDPKQAAGGTFDKHLSGLFTKLGNILKWRAGRTTNAKRIGALIKHLGDHGVTIEEADEISFRTAWMGHSSYFGGIVHGKSSPPAIEVTRRIEDCTSLLLARLGVPPSKAFDEIDKIVARAEREDAK